MADKRHGFIARLILRHVRFARLRLRRFDGQVYLDRWGLESRKMGGVFLHRMTAPDPGVDLHDHPWTFASLVLAGGYVEERALIRRAPWLASQAEADEDAGSVRPQPRGPVSTRRRWSIKVMRLDECHRITALLAPVTWTLVIHGPTRRAWGFYLPTGWVDEHTYDTTVRVNRRDLWNDEPRPAVEWTGT